MCYRFSFVLQKYNIFKPELRFFSLLCTKLDTGLRDTKLQDDNGPASRSPESSNK